MNDHLIRLKEDAKAELWNILNYWINHAIDQEHGGFYGRIDHNNVADHMSCKGSVLNGRILWTFSAAYISTKDKRYLELATRAYEYIVDHFIDHKFGGVYWTVTPEGDPLITKKHVYASAFVLYGLSEFYRATNNEEALQHAFRLYSVLTEHAYDKKHGGFFEAFTREWVDADDMRLSGKDANEKKSMNTTLHVIEAFASLYLVWPDEELKMHILNLLKIFGDVIIDPVSGHLGLFYDERWNNKSILISYGHDIEASWLLLDCAQIIGDTPLQIVFRQKSIKLAESAMEGLDDDGGLWYEYDMREKNLIKEKHWWPQAEAVVGFLNAWQVTGKAEFLHASLNCWNYINSHMIDKKSGEWYWGINENGTIMYNQDKVGLWKCPYHNTRACLEIIKRIESL